MKSSPKNTHQMTDLSGLSAAELLSLVSSLQQKLGDKDDALREQNDIIRHQTQHLKKREQYIELLEEQLRLKLIQQYAAKSEKSAHQIHLFDEVEMESDIAELKAQLPDDVVPEDDEPQSKQSKRRQRGFSDNLDRIRVELRLTDEQKNGALKTFFTKVKEELEYIPASLRVREIWQEKAVFNENDEESIVAAKRPVHPLGKCIATTSLLSYIIVSKYADGLPLYRLETIFKRQGHEISRTNMANWIIRLDPLLQPLINLMREVQNSSDYLQADETRIQVLKEDGKTAQSDKWMWVTRGGPPGHLTILFDYDPSRAGRVAVRLLDEFTGILQADGYSGYARICAQNNITRIGCWDHARRKFVEASKAKDKGQQVKLSKADMALSMINKLYVIEREIKDLSVADRYQMRQKHSIPKLIEFKAWLDKNTPRVMKKTLTRTAMDYTLNQWEYLIGYCERGDLHISNALAENAIRPFALGRRAWLFADTSQGAKASATCYSLIETAKANDLEPASYIEYVLNHIAEADTLEKLEQLLPWNAPLEKASKKSDSVQLGVEC
ncbi:MAG: IS66 family transposase [Nitrincola sp.]|nr:IS66 family transposase [Nitrincola sp.]